MRRSGDIGIGLGRTNKCRPYVLTFRSAKHAVLQEASADTVWFGAPKRASLTMIERAAFRGVTKRTRLRLYRNTAARSLACTFLQIKSLQTPVPSRSFHFHSLRRLSYAATSRAVEAAEKTE
jgi:hypothetical protein